MTAERHVLVLGLGNLLNTDEGIGVHAIWEMQRRHQETGRYQGVQLVDGGVLGMRLLPYVDEATHLVLLDCVDAGKVPGELVELEGEDIPLFYEPIHYVLALPGKRIRPLLTLLSAMTCNASLEDALPAAAAVELMHNFTLVHDDIMDNDDTRRGQPTVHKKWDVGM